MTSFQTRAVHAGLDPDPTYGSVIPAIHQTSTYRQAAVGQFVEDYDYARSANPTRFALERALGDLEGGRAVTFASGLAATTAIASLVPTGGAVVLSSVTYHGVRNIFEEARGTGRIDLRIVEAGDTDAVIAAAAGAAMVWVESIANPLLVVADVREIVAGARGTGALVVVDATFATPLRQRPLELGADVVLHAATKIIGGHSDLLLGAAVCRDPGHAATLASYRHDQGSIPGALEAFLALRGLRTLGVRLDRAEASAAELARRLSTHPMVSAVHYPGLPGDSQHACASRVLPRGCGSMLSFAVAGTVEQTEAFLGRLQLFTHATSLGGVESLIERRARYAGDAAVVGPTLCRVSVGLESVEDLWADLDAALRSAGP
jgi:cystathionine gamma-synthase